MTYLEIMEPHVPHDLEHRASVDHIKSLPKIYEGQYCWKIVFLDTIWLKALFITQSHST